MTSHSHLKDYKLDKNGKLRPIVKGDASKQAGAKKSKRVRVVRRSV